MFRPHAIEDALIGHHRFVHTARAEPADYHRLPRLIADAGRRRSRSTRRNEREDSSATTRTPEPAVTSVSLVARVLCRQLHAQTSALPVHRPRELAIDRSITSTSKRITNIIDYHVRDLPYDPTRPSSASSFALMLASRKFRERR
jgi:hypothetical protein